MLADLTLTPVSGTLLLIVMVFCGRNFRQNWKAQEEGWVVRCWLYAVPVLISFCALAFLPLEIG